jgi:beta-xylosidase
VLGPLTPSVLRPLLALLVALLLAATLVPLGAGSAGARPGRPNPFGSDPVVPGKIYRGDFPDPSVTRARGTWWAYGTGIGARSTKLNLPVLTSGGLRNWRPPTPFADAPDTDALPRVADWADWWPVGGRQVAITWAPSVARIKGRYVAAYSVRKLTRDGGDKMCISIATSRSPQGPFVDRSEGPLTCPGRRGAIDPDFYRQNGRWWLLFKTDDNSIGKHAKIWIRRLNKRGTAFPEKSRPHRLLKAKQDWEGLVVENPSMVRYRGTRYLFYSGNGWGSRDYGIGYAVCKHVTGPCKRVIDGPLIAANDTVNAPGGGDAFKDVKDGRRRLRLAYHAWDPEFGSYPETPAQGEACLATEAGCGQRRMHIARLKVKHGELTVAKLGWRPR